MCLSKYRENSRPRIRTGRLASRLECGFHQVNSPESDAKGVYGEQSPRIGLGLVLQPDAHQGTIRAISRRRAVSRCARAVETLAIPEPAHSKPTLPDQFPLAALDCQRVQDIP
jgi:hypothetical protein